MGIQRRKQLRYYRTRPKSSALGVESRQFRIVRRATLDYAALARGLSVSTTSRQVTVTSAARRCPGLRRESKLQREFAAEIEALDPAERKQLQAAIEDLASEGPRTDLAVS